MAPWMVPELALTEVVVETEADKAAERDREAVRRSMYRPDWKPSKGKPS